QPSRLRVDFRTENSGDVVWQTAQNRDDDEARDHRDNVAATIATRFGEHPGKKNSQHRAIGITVDSQNDRNDADVSIYDHKIGGDRSDNDHQDGEPNGGPPHST